MPQQASDLRNALAIEQQIIAEEVAQALIVLLGTPDTAESVLDRYFERRSIALYSRRGRLLVFLVFNLDC